MDRKEVQAMKTTMPLLHPATPKTKELEEPMVDPEVMSPLPLLLLPPMERVLQDLHRKQPMATTKHPAMKRKNPAPRAPMTPVANLNTSLSQRILLNLLPLLMALAAPMKVMLLPLRHLALALMLRPELRPEVPPKANPRFCISP